MKKVTRSSNLPEFERSIKVLVLDSARNLKVYISDDLSAKDSISTITYDLINKFPNNPAILIDDYGVPLKASTDSSKNLTDS
jgi:hypothetical protein